MIDIRLPNITAATEKGQLEQIRSYLYQLAQQLNWAMGIIDTQANEVKQKVEETVQQNGATDLEQATFAEVKSLIIKSADIVNAYYEEISRRLAGVYVAESDFGIYKEETEAVLTANSGYLDALFKNQQTLSEAVDQLGGVLRTDGECTTVLGSEAWCRIGVLNYEASGFPIYGMEIGQVNSKDGETVYKAFAQYRSDGVHLFDQNGIEVATISDHRLHITNAEMVNARITGGMTIGGYAVSTGSGLAFKWVGGNL